MMLNFMQNVETSFTSPSIDQSSKEVRKQLLAKNFELRHKQISVIHKWK